MTTMPPENPDFSNIISEQELYDYLSVSYLNGAEEIKERLWKDKDWLAEYCQWIYRKLKH